MTLIAPGNAASICDSLGRRFIADRLGVGVTAVSNAAVEGSFPPSWFDAIESLCREKGLECPRSMFRFKALDRPALLHRPEDAA